MRRPYSRKISQRTYSGFVIEAAIVAATVETIFIEIDIVCISFCK